MSGLFESLSTASNSLLAQRMGLDVVGQNIANINTPGYSRRSLVLAEVPPTDTLSAGGGVSVVEVRALRDALVEARLRRAQGGTAYDSALAEELGSVEASIGMPGASIDAELTRFFDAFAELAVDPTSAAARDEVVRQGSALSSAFRSIVDQMTNIRGDVDTSIRSSVDEVNRLAAEMANLNVEVAMNGNNVETIRDRQNTILGRLGELADVAVLARTDGGVDVTLSTGQPLVLGDTAYPLALSANGFTSIQAGGVDVTASLSGGRIGGLLHVRDTMIPGYLGQLDQMAFDIATTVNGMHASGFDAYGVAGGNFFAPPASVAQAAGNLSVDAALLADSGRLAASATGASGDNANARALAALRDGPIPSGGTRTPFDTWGQFAYGVGSDAANARSAASSHGDIVTQLQQLRAEVSGVSYDEEAAHMMRYQRAYEANARYFQTIVSTLDVLMDMVQ
jgi:flagellar hook-associated protein 1 FlgK